MDADGTNVDLLTPLEFGENAFRASPDWSPDGQVRRVSVADGWHLPGVDDQPARPEPEAAHERRRATRIPRGRRTDDTSCSSRPQRRRSSSGCSTPRQGARASSRVGLPCAIPPGRRASRRIDFRVTCRLHQSHSGDPHDPSSRRSLVRSRPGPRVGLDACRKKPEPRRRRPGAAAGVERRRAREAPRRFHRRGSCGAASRRFDRARERATRQTTRRARAKHAPRSPQKVYFDYDQDVLRDDARAVLDAKAAVLAANPAVTLVDHRPHRRAWHGGVQPRARPAPRRAGEALSASKGVADNASRHAEHGRFAAGVAGHRRDGVPAEPSRGVRGDERQRRRSCVPRS